MVAKWDYKYNDPHVNILPHGLKLVHEYHHGEEVERCNTMVLVKVGLINEHIVLGILVPEKQA